MTSGNFFLSQWEYTIWIENTLFEFQIHANKLRKEFSAWFLVKRGISWTGIAFSLTWFRFSLIGEGEKGRRIRELTSIVQKRFKFPENSVELYAEKVNNRGLCAIAQAESLRYKLLGGLAVRRYVMLWLGLSNASFFSPELYIVSYFAAIIWVELESTCYYINFLPCFQGLLWCPKVCYGKWCQRLWG